MEEYKTGRIILIHGLYSGWFDHLVRKITKSGWVHATMCINDKEMIEANGKEVVINVIPSYDLDNIGVFEYPDLTDIQKEKLVTAAKSHIGKRYDWKQMVGLLIYYVIGKPIKWLFGDKKESMICSELIAVIYEEAGIKLFDKKMDYIVPSDFANTNKLKRIQR